MDKLYKVTSRWDFSLEDWIDQQDYEDMKYLLEIAHAAKLPPEHDIDSLKWCQRFIMNIQHKINN